jgi:beta-phosphoglucomutase family hydrolase
MIQLKGFIFDMDGVIVDNHRYHFQAWMAFSEKYQFRLDENIYREQFNGKTNADLFKMIFGDISNEKISSYAMEKESSYQKIYETAMKPHKGLIDFLDFLVSKNYKLALGTSAPTSNVDFVLDKLLLRKYFPVIVDGPQVFQGKPHPEVYLKCIQKLGLLPQECVVFEDSLAGLEAGEKAGCKIVGVATSHDAIELRPKTELIISDFTEAKALLRL